MFSINGRKLALLLTAALITTLTFTLRASAQTPERDMKKEAQLWQELDALAPGSVETFKQATVALDKGDQAEAVRLYREVLKRAPEWDAVNRRLGYALAATGQKEEGFKLLRKAVALNHSPENLAGLAQTLAYPGANAQGNAAEKQEAFALAKEAQALNQDEHDASYTLLVAQLALDLQDEPEFRAATRTLVNKYPQEVGTHYFNAIRAAMDEEWPTAEAEIKRAGQLGLPAEEVQRFLDSGIHTRVLAWRALYVALGVVVLWALGIVLMFGLGKLLSKHTLRQLETADPNVPVGPNEQRLRSIYRTVINLAGLYYYISLPVVIFLLLGLTGALIYASFMAGHIPIKLVLVVGLGAIMTVYHMIRSLFVRHKQEDPGRLLRPEEAPGLWALAREVAGTVGTRPVNEIRVTTGTEVAVYERGNLRARMRDEAERVLLVGAGVLNGFRQNAFRAVLAHEYGHFLNRDTAGGDIALRVKTDMLNFARGIIASRQNTYWNLGFHFLRLYFKIFTIISHGAGRLQEVLADRLAAHHYGAAAFKEGLSHVVRRQIEFELLAQQEITSAVKARRALVNLYELPDPTEAQQQRTIEEEFNQAINRVTAETDTHPSPAERFHLISRMVARNAPAATGEVWALFADRAALTAELSASVEKAVGSRW